jgi:hypothetical protein
MLIAELLHLEAVKFCFIFHALRFCCTFWIHFYKCLNLEPTIVLVQRVYERFAGAEECRNEGFEVLTAVVMKSTIFWDLMLCTLLKVNQHFRGTCHLHLHGRRIS